MLGPGAAAGFLLHSHFAKRLHQLIVPCKKYHHQKSYTVDESSFTQRVARERGLIERVFRRAQEWKALHNTVQIVDADLSGSIFFVCMMMTNYGPPMVRDGAAELKSIAELQWPTSSYRGQDDAPAQDD